MRMAWSSVIAATLGSKPVRPEGTQEGKNTRYLATIRLYPLLAVSPEELWMSKQDTGPRELNQSNE